MTGRRGLALLASLLAALLLARDAVAGDALLQADRLELKDGVATGEGAVRVTLDDQSATGARFRYELATGLLTIEGGTWVRPEGALSFERAEIDLGDGQGVVFAGRYEGQDGRLVLEGQSLRWGGEGLLEGAQVRFTTCTCARPPWAVEAREVRVRLDDVASFTGGWIAICDLKVIPVPAGRFPLAERRSGLLMPQLGYGEDGLLLGQPVYLTLGPAADWTLTPELRSARSLRLLSELRYALPEAQGGELALAAGWDTQTERARGAMRLDHSSARGPLRAGADVVVWSDVAYGEDYGDSFLARQAPWTEALLHAGLGPLRLETDSFQGEDALGQRPLGVVLAAARPLGPVSTRVEARLDHFSDGEDPRQLDGGVARARAAARVSAGREIGVLRLQAELDGRASAWLDGAPWGQGRGGLGLTLPMWAPSGAGTLLLDAGVAASGALTLGEPDLRRPDDLLWSPFGLGPSLSVRRISASGVPISGALHLPWTDEGLAPEGELRLGVGSWQARAQADLQLQEGALAWDDGRLRVGVGLAHQEEVAQGRGELAWTLPGRLSALRPSWRGLVDLQSGAPLNQTLGLRYRPACDCVELDLSGALSEDRVLPELGLKLTLW